jgi:hypothetical protein
MAIGEGTMISTQVAFGYSFLVTTLALIAIVKADMAIDHEFRRQMMRSAPWADMVRGFVELLFDASSRTAGFFRNLFNRNLRHLL